MNDAVLWAVAGALTGLIAGSFIATLMIRWPQDRSLGGRSACDACDRTLSVRDLAPLLSWAIAAGKCRTCGARIDWRHPAVELAAGLIGLVALIAEPGLGGIAGALFGWQLLTLAALDFEHFWLPNRLTALLAVSGLALGLVGVGAPIVDRIIGGSAGFAALFAIAWTYRRLRGREGMGGGDPKLLGAIGCWLGWQFLPFVLLGASAVGMVVALVMLTRGQSVAADTRLPLGSLMAISAFPVWIFLAQS